MYSAECVPFVAERCLHMKTSAVLAAMLLAATVSNAQTPSGSLRGIVEDGRRVLKAVACRR